MDSADTIGRIELISCRKTVAYHAIVAHQQGFFPIWSNHCYTTASLCYGFALTVDRPALSDDRLFA